MSESMDVSELAFSIEDFLRPFARQPKGFGKWAEKFDDLGDVVIIFAILGA